DLARAHRELENHAQWRHLTADLARLGAEVALAMREPHFAKLALKRARQAVGDQPRDYRDALWLARFCDAAGEHADADKLLLKCLDEAGNAPESWLAWIAHLQQTRQRERGVKDLERLKKGLPSALQPLTIARCYEAMQMPEFADKAYRDALRATPDDLEAWEHASDFYRRADRDDEAI